MKINLKYTFFLGAIIALAFVFNNACKGPQPCKCVIKVTDSSGANPKAGVKVNLYANVTYNGNTSVADLKAEGTTDSEGKVRFTFKLPAVMDILATDPSCTTTNCKKNGKGIIKLEEAKEIEKTVKLTY